jgi:hypothetical protein
MDMWRRYLEQYAEREGNLHGQIVVGAYHSAEIFGSLSRILDRESKYRDLIDQREEYFRQGKERAETFDDQLVNGTFSIYNHVNTLTHQFAIGNSEAETLIRQVDEQVRSKVQDASQMERSASAMRAAFPLLSVMALVLDQDGVMTKAIREIEKRFAAGSGLVNSLYRVVEMMQVLVLLSDADLRSQVDQIAARFQEEDQTPEATQKIRNGFCRLFELTHLLTAHLDELLGD